MFKTTCLDNNGNTIYSMTQYDIGQKLNFELPNIRLINAPEIHFCNTYSPKELPVQSTINGQIISAPVPTELIIQPHPIIAHVYTTDNTDSSSKRAIAYIKIPMNKRKPSGDYDNADDVVLAYIADKTTEVNNLNNQIESLDIDTKISQMSALINEYNNLVASLEDAKVYL